MAKQQEADLWGRIKGATAPQREEGRWRALAGLDGGHGGEAARGGGEKAACRAGHGHWEVARAPELENFWWNCPCDCRVWRGQAQQPFLLLVSLLQLQGLVSSHPAFSCASCHSPLLCLDRGLRSLPSSPGFVLLPLLLPPLYIPACVFSTKKIKRGIAVGLCRSFPLKTRLGSKQALRALSEKGLKPPANGPRRSQISPGTSPLRVQL